VARRANAAERLRQWLDERKPGLVDEALAGEIRQSLGGVTAGRLRALLRSSGAALDPLVEGVRQDTWPHLERTLSALADLYETAPLETRRRCRGEVIQARQHALWAARRLEGEARSERERMREAMLVWLENPPVFRAWAAARRGVSHRTIPGEETDS